MHIIVNSDNQKPPDPFLWLNKATNIGEIVIMKKAFTTGLTKMCTSRHIL